LAFQIPKQPYSGKIGTTTVGKGAKAVTLGGAEAYPFYLFEGKMPNPPKIAMEVWDFDPSKDWPAAAVEPFKDVIGSPDAWAKKCVEKYGADMIVVQLKSTDPNGMDRSPADAAKVAAKILKAVDVPVIFWGTANNQKDEEVLKQISEACQGKNVGLSPVEEGNHKALGASALAYGQTIVASSPIDVNLAKQLNILLGNLGVPLNKLIIDPTTGGLGYGMEYSYSVIERIRMAALTQEDDKLQIPIIANVGNEIWRCKEAGQSIEDAPTIGDPERRAILMETVAATCYLLAGADIVTLRHPESVRLVRSFIQRMLEGGKATEVKEIAKSLPLGQADLAAIAPAPVLTLVKDEAGKAKPKAKEAPKAAKPEKKEEKPKAAAVAKEKVVEMKPKAEEEPKAKAEAEAKAKADAEAKVKAEAEAKAKAEAEAKAKEEAKKKAEEEAKKKAAEEAKKGAEEEARKRAQAKEEERDQLLALRQKRAAEREKVEAERRAAAGGAVPKKVAARQAGLVDRLMDNLDRIHRR
jgi:acetyl-CoA decarbonylase/synthase complex subunit delta